MTEAGQHILPIAVDAMGGDFGSDVVVDGSVEAARSFGIRSILVGDEATLKSRLDFHKQISDDLVQIRHASQVVTMEESPGSALRGKPQASVRVAFELVKNGEAAAVVSTGNTGAIMGAGVLTCGTLPGIARPAIATMIPKPGTEIPSIMLDVGANVQCSANQLVQFALMGEAYARCHLGIVKPQVGLLSNGTESSKGTDIVRLARETLARMSQINFIGYVEGRDIFSQSVDVLVCDGFVGNVVLKALEGGMQAAFKEIKRVSSKSLWGRLGALALGPSLKHLGEDKFDPDSFGGAPLLGLDALGLVCHGSAKSRAVLNAVRTAHELVRHRLVPTIMEALNSLNGADTSVTSVRTSNGMEN